MWFYNGDAQNFHPPTPGGETPVFAGFADWR